MDYITSSNIHYITSADHTRPIPEFQANFTILTKFHNFDQISQFDNILTKYHTSQLSPNFTILTTVDARYNAAHDSEHNAAHDSEHNAAHDSEHNAAHDSEHNAAHNAGHNAAELSQLLHRKWIMWTHGPTLKNFPLSLVTSRAANS